MSTLSVNTVKSLNTNAPVFQNTSGTEKGQLCKEWVNFDGTFCTSPFTEANGGIRDSFNVSSITDNGTGDYTLNFTNNMSSANYVLCMSGSTNNSYTRAGTQAPASMTASTARVFTANSGGSSADREYCAVAIFGDN